MKSLSYGSKVLTMFEVVTRPVDKQVQNNMTSIIPSKGIKRKLNKHVFKTYAPAMGYNICTKYHSNSCKDVGEAEKTNIDGTEGQNDGRRE